MFVISINLINPKSSGKHLVFEQLNVNEYHQRILPAYHIQNGKFVHPPEGRCNLITDGKIIDDSIIEFIQYCIM